MLHFFARMLSEPDGTPSASRFLTCLVVAFACGWVTAVVRYTHAIPDLGGITLFASSLYGLNKLVTAYTNKAS